MLVGLKRGADFRSPGTRYSQTPNSHQLIPHLAFSLGELEQELAPTCVQLVFTSMKESTSVISYKLFLYSACPSDAEEIIFCSF